MMILVAAVVDLADHNFILVLLSNSSTYSRSKSSNAYVNSTIYRCGVGWLCFSLFSSIVSQGASYFRTGDPHSRTNKERLMMLMLVWASHSHVNWSASLKTSHKS